MKGNALHCTHITAHAHILFLTQIKDFSVFEFPNVPTLRKFLMTAGKVLFSLKLKRLFKINTSVG